MIQFGNDYVDRLNRQYEKGKFIKAVVVTESVSPLVKSYWADHEVAFDFEGNTYTPLRQHWGKIKVSGAMPIAGAEIAVSNVGGTAVKYVKEIDITGNEVLMKLLHLDLLSTLTNYWRRKMKVLAAGADVNVIVFTVGRYLGRNRLPRGIILADEFPGLTSDVAKIL